jgi:serine protease inhibitor
MKTGLWRTVVVACGAGLVVSGLSGNAEAAKPADATDAKLADANNRFGFKLFAELLKQDNRKNVFISPSSVAFALAMTYNGAAGETQQAMAKTLELQGLSLDDVNRANASLRKTLTNPDPKVQLTIANSLWARKGFGFKEDFLKRNRDFFSAQVSELDFDNPGASAKINDWVSKSTNAKIKKIVEDKIDSDLVLFLINAIYFKGDWAAKFDKTKTADAQFFLLDGSAKKHPTMVQSGKFLYLEDKDFQAVSLPYGGGRMSMYVFLPQQGSSLDAFRKQLTPENWEQWMTRFHKMEGELALPRFKLEYETSLNDALKALGMGVAFDPGKANFEGMHSVSGDQNLYISEAKHKTFVEVNEEGAEAAAVTSIGISATSYEEPFKMVVNRPFFCAIRDNQTGSVLFMGSIVEPK